ncbi:glutathione peroxidase [Jannaschia rubra]|uniref:glutathione peroxidase n=1 Tax=Jannaschia rubra TaxID=282197 RepID=UPI0024930EA2|nr:glutathione peroxidase [Jannaschia rubra]
MRALLALLMTALPAAAFEFEAIDGGTIDLDDLRGRAVLVVNTASLCAFTGQYADLQTLQDRYGPAGLTVIAVPSNDFRQELDTEDEVARFCEVTYDLTLPLTSITQVTGADAHPFYRWLATTHGRTPRWNFNKALLGPDGALVAFEGSGIGPLSPRFVAVVEGALP